MKEHARWQHGIVYQVYPRSFQDSNGDGSGDLPGLDPATGQYYYHAYLPQQPDLTGVPANWRRAGCCVFTPPIDRLMREYDAALPPGGWPNWVLGNHDRQAVAAIHRRPRHDQHGGEDFLVFAREHGARRILVALNFGTLPRAIRLPGGASIILRSTHPDRALTAAADPLVLGAFEGIIAAAPL